MRMVCLIVMIFGLTGCASFGQKLKAFLRGSSSSEEVEAAQKAKFNGQTFSQNPNYVKGPKRKYKRMTKATLEDQSQLSDRSGSLWVMEGQGAYLFSQNIVRMIGDPLAVRIEGEPKEQLESKAKVISDLLDLIESRRQAATRRLAEAKEKPAQEAGGKEKGAKAAPAPGATEPKTNNKSDFSVKTVPTRVVERLVDGNYRVKGSQPFMIGQREYSVIVTGIVRAEDFSEEGISASKLLDPKFDIVSKRRREASL